MRYIGILIVIASLPAFFMILQSGEKARRWAFIALGALPIFGAYLNIDASFIDWAGWRGHTKGLVASLTDALALAICLKYGKSVRMPSFIWAWIFFVVFSIPALFAGDLFTPSTFFIFSLVKATIYFYACYIVIMRGYLDQLVTGLAISIIANGLVTIQNGLKGQFQASGMIGHRNYAGLVCNMAIPVLLVAGTRNRLQFLPLAAVFLSAVAAVIGGSRAVIILLGVSVFLTLLGALWVEPTKRIRIVLGLCLAGSVLAVPAAIYKLEQRFEQQGEAFTLEKDGERIAFERASSMINEDYPMGVGWSQYAIAMNAGGYASRAGVAWSTIAASATVHDTYALMRSEGGPFGLLGFLILLGSALIVPLRYIIRKGDNPQRIYAVAAFVIVLILAIHIQFEWVFVAMTTLYTFGLVTALAACVAEHARMAKDQEALGYSLPKRYGTERGVRSQPLVH